MSAVRVHVGLIERFLIEAGVARKSAPKRHPDTRKFLAAIALYKDIS